MYTSGQGVSGASGRRMTSAKAPRWPGARGVQEATRAGTAAPYGKGGGRVGQRGVSLGGSGLL